MTELAHRSQIEMEALGDYVNKQFEELFDNNKEHEESVENFKKILKSESSNM
jgi:hypothetical protein